MDSGKTLLLLVVAEVVVSEGVSGGEEDFEILIFSAELELEGR
jgi:hypothetical protein